VSITPARASVIAVAVSVAVLFGWVIYELAQTNPHRSGSNEADVPHFVENVGPGEEVCQPERVPKDTGGAAMLVTDYNRHPTPPVTLTIRDAAGKALATGRLPAGFVEGQNLIHFSPPLPQSVQGQLCLRDDGHEAITIGGINTVPELSGKIDGRQTDGRMSAQWFLPGNKSFFDIAGLVLSRVRYGKADWFGAWMPVVLVLLVLGTIALGIRVAVRLCD
jgi:hypothetical protein